MLFFIFFLLLAFIFWLMLFFQKEKVEGTYRFPLKYSNIPENVVFDHPLPDYIDVSIIDNGAEIFKLDIKRKDSLEINVAELAAAGIKELQGDRLRQFISSTLSSNTNEVRGYFPMNISLSTSELESRELPVTFDGEITTSRGNLVADSAVFIPETVMAYGSKASLSKLKSAVTIYSSLKNLNATSQLPIKINPVDGVKFSPSTVSIFIPIMEFTEHSFKIPITVSHLPSNLDVKFFPSKVTVSFSVTLEDYKKIDSKDFTIKLDYREFYNNADGRVKLALSHSPASIIDPRISPSTVEFLFENRGSK